MYFLCGLQHSTQKNVFDSGKYEVKFSKKNYFDMIIETFSNVLKSFSFNQKVLKCVIQNTT